MANYCSYDLMVRGKTADVEQFYRYMTDYDNSPKYFARIFSAEILERNDENSFTTMKVYGDCAWSVYSCMCDGSCTYFSDSNQEGKLTCLRDATKELNLEVEIHSEEEGMGFWEHIHYSNGECICQDCGDLHSKVFDME